MHHPIVVALDHSPQAERALEPAASLARRWSAPLAAVTVALAGTDPADDRYLGEVADRCADLVVERHVLSAVDADPALLRFVGERPESLLCLGSHGRSGLGHLLLGSVSEAIVRHLGRPVLLVGPEGGHPVADGPVVVPLDGSAASTAIVPEAVRWAAALDSRVELVHVGDDPGPDGPEAVAAAHADAPAPVTSRILAGDDPAEALIGEVVDTGASIVAMTTHGRSGLSRVVLGSVAARVVHRSPVPVLLLRP